MDFYEVVEKRRTVRDFESGTIPEEVLKRIITAALKAPTNDHMRDWHYIIIQDKHVILRLLDMIPKGISEEDMDLLIKDWNLSDSLQQECYRNAVPKQYRMLFDASAIMIPLLKQKVDNTAPNRSKTILGIPIPIKQGIKLIIRIFQYSFGMFTFISKRNSQITRIAFCRCCKKQILFTLLTIHIIIAISEC